MEFCVIAASAAVYSPASGHGVSSGTAGAPQREGVQRGRLRGIVEDDQQRGEASVPGLGQRRGQVRQQGVDVPGVREAGGARQRGAEKQRLQPAERVGGRSVLQPGGQQREERNGRRDDRGGLRQRPSGLGQQRIGLR